MVITKFYTCRYDRAFKEVFMNEKNKDLLIYLLEGILKVKINEVEYLNLEQNVDNVSVKRKYFDLNLKTDIGRIQVEVNASDLGYVRPRNMSYLCDVYSHHVLKGQNYREDVKIIQINFSYGLKDTKALRVYYIQGEEEKKYVENFVIYEINMEKYMSFWYTNNVQEIEKNKEIIMLDLGLEELKTLSKKDRMVEKYMDELKRVNEDPDFHVFMSAEEDNRKIENSIREEMIEKGLKEGMEKGLKQGLEKGLKQGLEQGLEEGLKQGKNEMIVEMLKNKVDMHIIAKCAKVSLDEIEKIAKNVN